jgi:hypothetical protein
MGKYPSTLAGQELKLDSENPFAEIEIQSTAVEESGAGVSWLFEKPIKFAPPEGAYI